MKIKIPAPISGGLLLSHKCNARCSQCMYACSPKWEADWISQADLETMLNQLAKTILPSVYGPEQIDLSHGLHFTGGEPFLNFDLLVQAVEIAEKSGIPSTFVETNGYWAKNEDITREKLTILKEKGLKGMMVSINPFYLEYIPFERTDMAIKIGYEIFGESMIPYQFEYYQKFKQWGIKGTLSFDEYVNQSGLGDITDNAEFFLNGRAPFVMDQKIPGYYPKYAPEALCMLPCSPDFLRSWHNHFDNYGNYMPGFCGGISLGDCRELDKLITEGIEVPDESVLSLIIKNHFLGLLKLAKDLGYQVSESGYFSKCHLCTDIRKHLVSIESFKELTPLRFYQELN
jgi:hypothetical protein